MTSNTTRPSYKEAQERLLKWCQHVTRDYEVSVRVILWIGETMDISRE